MHTTTTLPAACDIFLDEEEPCPEGMYGPLDGSTIEASPLC